MGAAKWVAAGLGIAVAGAAAVYAQYRNTEEPEYTVVKNDEAFELRDYPTLVVAEVTSEGRNRREASGASFNRLAAYIFAKDRPEGGEKIAMTAPVIMERAPADEKIAMTAPVIQEKAGADLWRMRFVMPAKYSLETLPAAPSDINLTEVPGRRMASVTFNGYAPSDSLARMEALLRQWIEGEGLTPVGDVEYAFYDAPMVPGQFRRNEVMIEVAVD